jgi:Cu(I)/Ag(I) efflux system membrane protein CusA/SilA
VLNTATQVSVEKFDRTMRDLARRRQLEYEPRLADELVRFTYERLVTHLRKLQKKEAKPALLREPTPGDFDQLLPDLRRHGVLLAQVPRQEELDKLLAALRQRLVSRGIAADRDDLLLDQPGALTTGLHFVQRVIGSEPPNFSERTLQDLEAKRDELWRARVKTLNWELFDYAKVAATDLLLDSLYRTAAGTPLAGNAPGEAAVAEARQPLADAFGKVVFLWQKTRDDLQKEMDSELQMPGWGNVWTQPIINRVNMLATGVRTQIGVKVFGPTGKPLQESVADIEQFSRDIAERLKTVRGAVDVTSDQATGKRYVEVYIDREKAARYGVNVADVAQAVETAMGGGQVTTTVEGRQRFPVQLRYSREYWQDVDVLGDVLVTGATTPASLATPEAAVGGAAGGQTVRTPGRGAANMGLGGGPAGAMGGAAAAGSGGMGSAGGGGATASMAPGGGGVSSVNQAASGMIQIPLRMVADVRVVDGPSMIKSENGRLRNYVTLNVRDRDIIGFVEEARQAVREIEQRMAGTGMSIEWSGEFEAQVRARQTLAIIFPMVIVMILLILYVTFRDVQDMLLMALAVPGALAGAVMFQALFGFNFSVIVSIGYVAAFGMATQTGVIMLVYLREAIDHRGGLEGIRSLEELRRAVIEGAVHRLRPKLLTEGVAIVGLVPMLWATGTGAEIMRPMAAPVLGGLLISDEVIDVMIPVLFYWVRKRRWLKLRSEARAEPKPLREARNAAVSALAAGADQ